MRNTMSLAVLILLAGLTAYVRLAPSDLTRWHIDLADRPAPIGPPSLDAVMQLPNGAYIDSTAPLVAWDTAALSTPRTSRLAGSPAQGRVTYITRSLIWGFPDYTTAQSTSQGTLIFARQRFGGNDWGVNAARLRDWLARL
jgi:hypothetical protein